jgi:hypothetical protein
MIVGRVPGAPGLAGFARPGSGYVRCVRHGYCPFFRHFGSRVVDVVLAQVSQQRRDLGHPAVSRCQPERLLRRQRVARSV